MKIRDLLTGAIPFLLGLSPALVAQAGPPSAPVVATALGDEGQLYQMIPGTLGSLFPDDETQPADSPVLALDLVRPDGTLDRSLVPGSEGPEVEGAPAVVFEDASQRLYAVWESKKTPTVSRLLLASFGAEGWAEPIEISGDVSPLKDEPRVLITRDRFSLRNADGEKGTRSRTAIHVVWREDGAAGSGVYYTPVLLEAGRYLGWNPVVALAELEPDAPDSQPGSEASELLRAPELAAGQDIHSAVIGYLSPASGRLVILEARLLPGELGFLGDDFRGQIIEIGAADSGDIGVLADKFRGHIIEIGRRLNGGVVRHLAQVTHDSLLDLAAADPDRPIEALADDFRGHIIEIGANLFGGPGNNGRVSKLMELGPARTEPPAGPNAPSVTHLVRLELVSDRPAPPLDGVPAKIFLSEDGETVLVGWVARGKVYYTESLGEPGPGGEAWTAVKHMTLTERLGVVEAAAILEARVRRQR